MLQHLRLFPFLAGALLGLVIIFFYKTPEVVVYDYPHPRGGIDRVYRDKNGMCYKYTSSEVDCDSNEASLKPYPLQA